MKKPKLYGLAIGLAAVALTATAVPASGKPVDRGRFHDTSSEVLANYCGGLTIRFNVDVSGTYSLNSRGPDGRFYGMETVHGTTTTTNLANGLSLTEKFNVLTKDLRVSDNSDGTYTVLVLATGSYHLYGPDGKIAYNDPGQVRYEILVDNGGTPADPTDDEFVEFLGVVKPSTGRNDTQGVDFCDIVHQLLA
jgi:hypothetical protein